MARFVDWYRREGAPRPSGTAPPTPTPGDVVRFLAWYRRNGAPTPSRAPAPDERPPNNELVARYLEAYHHSVASAPHTPLPVVVELDAQPVSEEVARFVEWYRREGAPRPSGLAPPPPTSDDVVRFLAWYRRNGAPTPNRAPGTEEQHLTNDEVARYLEAYRHSGAPTPHASQPVVVPIDVQPMPSAVADTRSAAMSEEVARFVEWYKREGAPRPTGTAQPPPTSDDVVRFLAWYRRNGAPTPLSGTRTEEQHLTNDEVARYLEAYRHKQAPPSLPVVTEVDLKPVPTATAPSEEVARFVDWYKREGAPRPSGTAPPPPTPDDVVRFLAWYRRNGAPTPISGTGAEEQHLTNVEVARYLEAYRHNGAPPPLPVVTQVDVKPIPPAVASSEEAARFVDWYKHEGAPRPSGIAPPPPTPDDVVRFLAWYRRNGAPTPLSGTRTEEQHLTNDEIARYLEAYQHNSAPVPHEAPLPVVTEVDLKPVPSATAPSEEVARFVDWYRREGAQGRLEQPPPPPTPDDVVRFLAWYSRNGAPTPIRGTTTNEQQPTNDEIARFLDAYRHSGVPTPHPLPVVTNLDVQPVYDPNVQTVVAQEPAPPVLIVQAPQPTEVRPPSSTLLPVPPPPPLPMAPPQATQSVVATAPAPLPPALAEPPSAPPAKPPTAPAPPTPPAAAVEQQFLRHFDAILQQVGCSSCGTGGGLLSAHGPGEDGSVSSAGGPGCNCGSGGCVPGRLHQCSPCEADTAVGRFLCGVYECICCPDPCYDPHWIPIADAAFFTESARPQTQQSIGWDAGRNLTNPDRAEYFWARADGKGAGPNPANHGNPNGLLGESSVNYNDLWLYTEAALGNIGTFVYMPYRSLDGELVGHAAGFSDMQVGTKTLLFDCELLQIAFEFRTFIPIGDAAKGLGTGHVSLEPGLIVGLKLGPETYFQGQVEEWIPIGGDPDYEGALLEYHMSVNQVLCRILPDVPLVGTAELSGWSFQHGLYTDPVLGPGQRASGGTYIAIGPGLRLFICDKIDFGIGTSFAVTDRHFADQLFRTEFRWRF